MPNQLNIEYPQNLPDILQTTKKDFEKEARMAMAVKLFETLLNREEMACAQDLGDYYRIPVDARDLNYNKYFVEGEEQISSKQDYTSNNAQILTVEEIKEVLLKVGYIQEELSHF